MNISVQKQELVTVPKALLLVVCDLAANHVADIQTGLEDGTYFEIENEGIGEKNDVLLKVIESINQPVCEQNDGEHEVSYAYPSSPLAIQLGYSGTGCFVFSKRGQTLPFTAKSDALVWASLSGTRPMRWSIDHPANQHLASAQ